MQRGIRSKYDVQMKLSHNSAFGKRGRGIAAVTPVAIGPAAWQYRARFVR